MRLRRSVAAAAAVALASGGALVVFPPGAGSRTAETITVVASHLNNPRNLSIGPDGALYVAEAGRAGPRCNPKTKSCVGFTSSITRVLNGKVRRIVTGLTSIGGRDGSFTVGVDGVGVTQDGSRVYMVETAVPECGSAKGLPLRAQRQLGRLFFVPRTGGRARAVANLAPFECRRNPDGADRNSDPYAVLPLTGRVLVVDAGANAIYNVRGNKISLLAVLPKNRFGLQSVPTAITLGPDGNLYIGELGGEGRRVHKGEARVWQLIPSRGHVPTVYATGFNNITGIAFDKQGNLYVTELLMNPANQKSFAGDVVKVARDGHRTRLGVGKLFGPSGAVVDQGGSLYVSNYSVLPASTPKNGPFKGAGGQLVKITQP